MRRSGSVLEYRQGVLFYRSHGWHNWNSSPTVLIGKAQSPRNQGIAPVDFVIKKMIALSLEKRGRMYRYKWSNRRSRRDDPKVAFVKYGNLFRWFIGTGCV